MITLKLDGSTYASDMSRDGSASDKTQFEFQLYEKRYGADFQLKKIKLGNKDYRDRSGTLTVVWTHDIDRVRAVPVLPRWVKWCEYSGVERNCSMLAVT